MKLKWFEFVWYVFIVECVVFIFVILLFKWKLDCNDVCIKYKVIFEYVICKC